MARRPVAVDVFAGVGGLSLGLRRAGFRIAAAVEANAAAARSFKANHARTRVIIDDVCNVRGEDVTSFGLNGEIDLLAGCAPCQGFSSLTRKHKREDPRNHLLLEMARLAEEITPAAILMENVPGLADVGRTIFDRFLRRLRRAGYYASWDIFQMADYGVPQYRRRLVLVAGRGFAIPFPERTHCRAPEDGSELSTWVSLREAIYGRGAPIGLGRARKNGGPRAHDWHVVRDLQPQTKARLRAALPGSTWKAYGEKLRPPCHRGGYEGFLNVYGRMVWDQPSVTITAGCTTPAKGRFGHPDRRRSTISVREAALLQTFPEDYRFESDQIDAVCDMIGNAVPPLFAEAFGGSVRRSLNEHRSTLARAG